MTADGLAAVLLGEPRKSPLICVPTRPKHQHRQARMLEFGVLPASSAGTIQQGKRWRSRH
jgi:hypothetical protein